MKRSAPNGPEKSSHAKVQAKHFLTRQACFGLLADRASTRLALFVPQIDRQKKKNIFRSSESSI